MKLVGCSRTARDLRSLETAAPTWSARPTIESFPVSSVILLYSFIHSFIHPSIHTPPPKTPNNQSVTIFPSPITPPPSAMRAPKVPAQRLLARSSIHRIIPLAAIAADPVLRLLDHKHLCHLNFPSPFSTRRTGQLHLLIAGPTSCALTLTLSITSARRLRDGLLPWLRTGSLTAGHQHFEPRPCLRQPAAIALAAPVPARGAAAEAGVADVARGALAAAPDILTISQSAFLFCVRQRELRDHV